MATNLNHLLALTTLRTSACNLLAQGCMRVGTTTQQIARWNTMTLNSRIAEGVSILALRVNNHGQQIATNNNLIGFQTAQIQSIKTLGLVGLGLAASSLTAHIAGYVYSQFFATPSAIDTARVDALLGDSMLSKQLNNETESSANGNLTEAGNQSLAENSYNISAECENKSPECLDNLQTT